MSCCERGREYASGTRVGKEQRHRSGPGQPQEANGEEPPRIRTCRRKNIPCNATASRRTGQRSMHLLSRFPKKQLSSEAHHPSAPQASEHQHGQGDNWNVSVLVPRRSFRMLKDKWQTSCPEVPCYSRGCGWTAILNCN